MFQYSEHLILICALTCMFTMQLQSYHKRIADSTLTHTHSSIQGILQHTVAVALYVLQNVLRMCIASSIRLLLRAIIV